MPVLDGLGTPQLHAADAPVRLGHLATGEVCPNRGRGHAEVGGDVLSRPPVPWEFLFRLWHVVRLQSRTVAVGKGRLAKAVQEVTQSWIALAGVVLDLCGQFARHHQQHG
jgi:hypothetical protein